MAFIRCRLELFSVLSAEFMSEDPDMTSDDGSLEPVALALAVNESVVLETKLVESILVLDPRGEQAGQLASSSSLESLI